MADDLRAPEVGTGISRATELELRLRAVERRLGEVEQRLDPAEDPDAQLVGHRLLRDPARDLGDAGDHHVLIVLGCPDVVELDDRVMEVDPSDLVAELDRRGLIAYRVRGGAQDWIRLCYTDDKRDLVSKARRAFLAAQATAGSDD